MAFQPQSEPPQQRRTSRAALLASSEIAEPIGPPGEAGDQASFKVETIARAAPEDVLSRVTMLEALMAEMPKHPVGIGHNQQPPITREDVDEIKDALASLKAQRVVLTEAKAAASTLKKIGGKLGAYLDAFVMELAKSAGKQLVLASAPLWYWYFFNEVLTGLANSVMDWLRHIP
jgi:hypothetical protein